MMTSLAKPYHFLKSPLHFAFWSQLYRRGSEPLYVTDPDPLVISLRNDSFRLFPSTQLIFETLNLIYLLDWRVALIKNNFLTVVTENPV